MRSLAGAALLVALALSAPAQELAPFVLPWDDAAPGPTDRSTLLHQPAGALGTVHAGPDGHLYAGAKRIRFFGVNCCFGANFPERSTAEKIAARMAKFGINCVRFHHMDSQPFPSGILRRGSPSSRQLDPDAVDRLVYFINQLSRHGIYADLNLLVSRRFRAADGLPDAIESVPVKTQHLLGFFDPALLALQQEYARALLTAMNPDRGRRLIEDPAVAVIEINNENGLIHGWLGGELDRLPEPYALALRQRWNAWLQGHYHTTDALRTAWGARSQPLGPSLLTNGDFSKTMTGWILERHEGADAAVEIVPGGWQGKPAAHLAVRRRGSADWHVQFNQPGLAVQANQVYTLRFVARAEPAGSVTVRLSQAHTPWQELGFAATVPLTADWREYRYTLVASASDRNARIGFADLGKRRGAYWIANLQLQPGGSVGLPASARVEDETIPLPPAHGGEPTTAAARRDWIGFLAETERHYWQAMAGFLKNDLGAKALIVGTIIGTSTPTLQAELDAVDSHAYWQHPQFPGRPWDPDNWTVQNVSMVNSPPGVLGRLAAQQVVGKPHLVTEYNHSAPNSYSSEAPLLLAAYAGLQDWDGVFLFAYSHRTGHWDAGAFTSFFDIDQHPPKMANVALAASLFLRSDIAPAQSLLTTGLTLALERTALAERGRAWQLVDAGVLGLPLESMLVHRIALQPGARAMPNPAIGIAKANRYTSDTGELIWDVSQPRKGVITVNTARTKAVIGFVDGRTFRLGDVAIKPGHTRQDWCTIGLTLMDGPCFTGPCHALLVATGMAENSQMQWKTPAKTSVGRHWGIAPSLVEVVPFELTLPASAGRVLAWKLDEHGQRAHPLIVQDRAGKAQLKIGPDAGTLWYELEIR